MGVQDWWPLTDIAEMSAGWDDVETVEYRQLHTWSVRADTNDFPPPKRIFGRYKLYDMNEVREWMFLYQRISRRFRRDDNPIHRKQAGNG